MKTLKTLTILFNIVFLPVLSIAQEKLNLKEINKYLAEGLEAKELLKDKINKLSECDSIVYYSGLESNNLKTQNILLNENIELTNTQKEICLKDLNKANNNIDVLNCLITKEKKKKKTWRNIATVELIFIIFAGSLTYLTIK